MGRMKKMIASAAPLRAQAAIGDSRGTAPPDGGVPGGCSLSSFGHGGAEPGAERRIFPHPVHPVHPAHPVSQWQFP
jgi:hypothetical protein